VTKKQFTVLSNNLHQLLQFLCKLVSEFIEVLEHYRSLRIRSANILVKDKSFIAAITVEMITNPEVRLATLKRLSGEVTIKMYKILVLFPRTSDFYNI